MQVTCDNCHKEYDIIMRMNRVGDIEKNYFKCPHCQTEYITACVDPNIRKKQLKVKKLYQQLKLLRDEQKIIKNVNQINDLESEIKSDMAELKKEIE